MGNFSEFAFGLLVGVWLTAAIIEIVMRKGWSIQRSLGMLMGLVGLVALVSYVASGQ